MRKFGLRSHVGIAVTTACAAALFGATSFTRVAPALANDTESSAPPSHIELEPPLAKSPCAERYAARLQSIALDYATRLSQSYKQLRAGESELPGKWVFTEATRRERPQRQTASNASAATKRSISGNGRCAEYVVDRRGRETCSAWSKSPDGPPNAAAGDNAIATTPARLRQTEVDLRQALAGVVKGKGALPEMAANGRQQWVARRITTDLAAYVQQPSHPALCTGVAEMLSFYDGNLKGLWARAREVQSQAQKARDLAAQRLAELDPRTVAQSVGEVSVGTKTTLIQTASLAPSTASPQLPATPGDTSTPAVYRDLGFRAATVLFGKVPSTAGGSGPLPELRELSLQPVSAESGADDRARAKAALAMVETGHYAELVAQRYRDLEGAVTGTLLAIRRAHQESCTCEN